ncbi:MAG: dihydroorotase [Bacteroidales bacterium]|nr:dihydroorotase [Bacteroidales bacterium]MDD3431274.1 dihydroorotase [Bacteroidales bacterium]MDD4360871.1 dihydroorotase [Bacteroidales bacterium]MDD4430600.1 dihydroorotase [Bacteroidales bacterium]
MQKCLIQNATLINEGKIFKASVLIEGEYISRIFAEEDSIPTEVLKRCQVIQAEACFLLPGVIDTHVHFREPGLTHKADMLSESRAALAGGVTSFFDMPNTIPQTTSLAAWEQKTDLAAEHSMANYAFYLGATNTNLPELLKADYSRIPAVKLFMGASTGNMLVDESSALKEIFSNLNALIAIHAESESIIRQNKERYTAQAGTELPIRYHSLIRDTEACYRSSAQAVEWATKYGSRLHILHLSTQSELSLLQDRALEEKKITAEVCVHHMWFDDRDYDRLGAAIKWNPSVKSEADKMALRAAVNTNLIDVVATDHSPHLWSEKEGSCLKAASGAPAIQFGLLLMLELSDRGAFSLSTVVEKMCHAPARLFRIAKRGFIREGYYADLTLLKPGDERKLKKEEIISKCGWSPYEDENVHWRVQKTFVNGTLVYDEGRFTQLKAARALEFTI